MQTVLYIYIAIYIAGEQRQGVCRRMRFLAVISCGFNHEWIQCTIVKHSETMLSQNRLSSTGNLVYGGDPAFLQNIFVKEDLHRVAFSLTGSHHALELARGQAGVHFHHFDGSKVKGACHACLFMRDSWGRDALDWS